MMSGSGKQQNRHLSLDEVISAVLESDDDDFSDIDESDSDIRDFKDDEGNQQLFILNTQTSRQPALQDAIYRDTLLDSEDDEEEPEQIHHPEVLMAFLDIDYIPRNLI